MDGAAGLGRGIAQLSAAAGEEVLAVSATLAARARLLGIGGTPKTAVAVVLVVLQILTTTILGGLGTDELPLMLILAAGAVVIYAAPAVTANPTGPDAVVTADRDAGARHTDASRRHLCAAA